MRTASEIYTAYRIMPMLAAHQLRVAAVGRHIADAFPEPLDKEGVVLAGLFHDMGNILKANLSYFPELVGDVAYWKTVQEDFRKTYGPDEHEATLTIAREIGLSTRVQEYMADLTFGKMRELAEGASLEKKICKYADMRVAPYGVTSLEERLTEARERYQGREVKRSPSKDFFDELADAARTIEHSLFERLPFTPADITEASMLSVVAELSQRQIGA